MLIFEAVDVDDKDDETRVIEQSAWEDANDDEDDDDVSLLVSM